MLDAIEVKRGGMLIDYAKGVLSIEEMEQITVLLSHDLELGEELERIYIFLEGPGQLP